ncbi:hypothetical protein [Candidatus Palauibacter sp.]|uniref:hypothetical protein n=1 Tax=Candidatus Palauibacter sp. TaxID=3101350 RepID=UPI003AF23146
MTFDAAVDITGTPQLELDFDGTAKAAACAAATNTTAMVCSYTVADGDSAPDGIAITVNKLTGGTITATGSTTVSADLDHTAVPIDAAKTIGKHWDGILLWFRSRISNGSTAWASRAFASRRLQLSGAVKHGDAESPRHDLTRSQRVATMSTRSPCHASRSTAPDLPARPARSAGAGAFRARPRYAFPRSRLARALALSVLAGMALLAPGDASAQTAERVLAISRVSLDSTYNLGDTISVNVTFSAAVTVTGTPQLGLEIGTDTLQANYASGSGTQTLQFDYEVAAGNEDTDGIWVPANALTLNGGTITATGSTTAADLDHSAVSIDAGHKVDGVRPTLVTTGTDAPTTSADGTKVILTFSEAIGTVDNTKITVKKGGTDQTTTGAAINSTNSTVEVTVRTFTITVTSVTISDDVVFVGFSTDPHLRPGEHLSISYTKPASNPLKDASDNEVASTSPSLLRSRTRPRPG